MVRVWAATPNGGAGGVVAVGHFRPCGHFPFDLCRSGSKQPWLVGRAEPADIGWTSSMLPALSLPKENPDSTSCRSACAGLKHGPDRTRSYEEWLCRPDRVSSGLRLTCVKCWIGLDGLGEVRGG
jgi:hypothetical protein